MGHVGIFFDTCSFFGKCLHTHTVVSISPIFSFIKKHVNNSAKHRSMKEVKGCQGEVGPCCCTLESNYNSYSNVGCYVCAMGRPPKNKHHLLCIITECVQ